MITKIGNSMAQRFEDMDKRIHDYKTNKWSPLRTASMATTALGGPAATLAVGLKGGALGKRVALPIGVGISALGVAGQVKDRLGRRKQREGLINDGTQLLAEQKAIDYLKRQGKWQAGVTRINGRTYA